MGSTTGQQEIGGVEQQSSPPLNLYAGPRGVAVKILNRIERSDAYLDRVMEAEMRSTDMNELDKSLMNEIVTGVIRWRMKLDWLLTGFFHGNFTKAETNIRNCLRVGLYQILFLNRVPHSAAVNEGVAFIKRIRGQKTADLVNAILRNIIRSIDNLRYPDPEQDIVQFLAVTESHPQWMVRRWVDRYGKDETKLILIANNQRPDLTIRVNRLKIDLQYFMNLLSQKNVDIIKSEYIDYFVRIKNLADIGKSEIYQQGLFAIQDESAGLAVQLLDPKPGERIIDLCAAPGGKTTFIGELLKNTGEIVAVDKYEARLNFAKNACQRLGIVNAHFIAADSTEIKLPQADRVIVDVPCSGLGILAKKPDSKWKRSSEDLLRLAPIQKKLLENGSTLVKPGGILVYSTCTTEPEENFEIVKAFLEQHPEFTVEPAEQFVPPLLVSTDHYIQTLPHKHTMDGSFAIRLRNNG
jgi:16S rRNA (cytosine967-C5)-methyltransferase